MTAHCKPSSTRAAYEITVPGIHYSKIVPASGLRRGVVVFHHGWTGGGPGLYGVPPVIADNYSIVPAYLLALGNALAADGWVFVMPSTVDDLQISTTAVHDDVVNDPAHGARYLDTTLRWWDHLVRRIRTEFGSTIPIMTVGSSFGGWRTLQIAKNRQADLGAYAVLLPLTVLSAAVGIGFNGSENTTGLDLTAHWADTITIPGFWDWHTSDSVVGYTLAQTIYNNAVTAGRTLAQHIESGDHIHTSTDMTAITGWFTSTVDPSYPKVFA